MTELAIQFEHRLPAHALIKPEPRSPISIRPATKYDLVFIDSLMKQHSKMVGFASMKELETHIEEGTALVAEEGIKASREQGIEGQPHLMPGCLDASMPGRPIGYLLYRDRYMKREDCGYVSQLNVAPSKHRGLVGAALVKAMFERVPYGVRLFCCWCAQDLEANHFWEAIGFVPLAYRTGSRGKSHGGNRAGGTRLHIFWQRRVREEDTYSYWYPSQTTGGRMGEARLVLPIEPGTRWSDVKLVVLPGMGGPPTMENINALPADAKEVRAKAPRQRVRKDKAAVPAKRPSCGMWFAPPTPPTPPKPTPEEIKAAKAAAKPKREKQKNDPKLVAAAREFRDRYLEEVNSGAGRCLLEGDAKYDVSRPPQLAAGSSTHVMEHMPAPHPPHLLNAA